jgi:ubiquinone/menaquinone biosynthesis C-methylase UbiE
MSNNLKSSRREQIQAWSIAIVFLLGLHFHVIGVFTGPILLAWFVGTQRPLQGFLLLVAVNYLPTLITNWAIFPHTGALASLDFAGWMFFATILTAIPFSFHSLVSPRLPKFAATLPLPLAAGALLPLLLPLLPLHPVLHFDFAQMFNYWFATVLVWMWRHEYQDEQIGVVAGIYFTVQCAIGSVVLLRALFGGTPVEGFPIHQDVALVLLLPTAGLAIWALILSLKVNAFADQPQTLAKLRSPNTKEPLQLVREKDTEVLLSPSGERFPIQDGIPAFINPQDLTGANLKYHNLYELIAGFYDDFQRTTLALRGINREAYFRSYIDLLQVKPGDSVLETSIGTGLNFKYLPRSSQSTTPQPNKLQFSGVDISTEMLLSCQANLRVWNLEANLFLANPESLPFADSCFDVVFHIGGTHFFNDRAKAIREMIRVAKPGSLLLIADETEKHIQSFYDHPLGHYFKRRKPPVTPPIDLLPPDMQDIHLEELRDGHFYALTFRKPAQP